MEVHLQEYIRHLQVLNQQLEQENYVKYQQINQLLHEDQEHVRRQSEGEEKKMKMAERITELEEELRQERAWNLMRRFMPPRSWTPELLWLVRLHLFHRRRISCNIVLSVSPINV